MFLRRSRPSFATSLEEICVFEINRVVFAVVVTVELSLAGRVRPLLWLEISYLLVLFIGLKFVVFMDILIGYRQLLYGIHRRNRTFMRRLIGLCDALTTTDGHLAFAVHRKVDYRLHWQNLFILIIYRGLYILNLD